MTVGLAPSDVEAWMSGDIGNGEDDVVLFLSVRGGVPLPAENLHIRPRHLNRCSIGATVSSFSAEIGAHVRTATVGHDVSLLGLADVGTVGTGHQDCRTWGSGEQGHGTEVGGLLSDTSQGAEPRVAVLRVLKLQSCVKGNTVPNLMLDLSIQPSIIIIFPHLNIFNWIKFMFEAIFSLDVFLFLNIFLFLYFFLVLVPILFLE